ncbi:S-adenosyl-L-methionine-dependent methyltransferase [Tricharina praecox]|uniref:S-adenosyl-L-methionine-dependent methyltransferase n=1 Tax=Tricharina praecox TaxID=43433 RepID=UPI00221E95FB|nr:S-adenosyl-L-methionine-dependent methyltransferase [Tricharina praecox]KAI5849956.1 S-adenosyl-L-methionine-dependent methyltransferase [Tricharina praecox]
MTTLNPIAATGFTAADSYDAHRPSYHPAAVSFLISSLGLPESPKILELASGTGKFTELLVPLFSESGKIVAVEPHDAMADVLREKKLPVEVKKGSAVDIPVEDGWADTVITAQAFHWFATTEALTSIARVLNPSGPGTLGLIWNVEDYNQSRIFECETAWESSMRDLNWQYTTDDALRFKDGLWRCVFAAGNDQPFNPVEERLFREVFWVGREGLWERLNTLSNIAIQGEKEKEELRTKFDRILDNAGDLERNDKDEFAVHSTCVIAWTALKGAEKTQE